MRKLLDFLTGNSRKTRPEIDELLPVSEAEITEIKNPRRHQTEPTRPTYRIGKHEPTDIYRAIDLSG